MNAAPIITADSSRPIRNFVLHFAHPEPASSVLLGPTSRPHPGSAGLLRLLVAVLGGFLVLRLTGSLPWVFAALSAGLVLYGVLLAGMVASGAWFRPPRQPAAVISDV